MLIWMSRKSSNKSSCRPYSRRRKKAFIELEVALPHLCLSFPNVFMYFRVINDAQHSLEANRKDVITSRSYGLVCKCPDFRMRTVGPLPTQL